MENRDIVVIGASAGGVTALKEVVACLPGDLKAAVFIVQHLSPETKSYLPEILSYAGNLPAAHPKDGEIIEAGRIYVAKPDYHMIVEDNTISVKKGPKENRFRPSIDVTMRSVACQFGGRAIGIVLTGRLTDGTSGLWSVKEMGGTTIVQAPEDSMFADMPNNVIKHIDVHHIVPLQEIGPLIIELVGQSADQLKKTDEPLKELLKIETEIAAEENALEKGITEMGEKTNLTCPECGGALVSLREGTSVRYRCHTGHGFSSESLWLSINESIETKLWQAVRSLEEGIIFLEQSATHYDSQGDELNSTELYGKADELKSRSKALIKFIYN
ncbi:chemotaxis protein CheB [Dyadobacter sp. Leaf189]|uniref:chemotaxis protein CheB n=1 Tax=Dyadobacter sp. Leaf189 TaxID=1736295 RepID=UPI0006F82AAA|nr:chemotaxis protein CheB [Dyadobacter sp. Leaf189]KQS30941.1 chemotaxis protein CheB [Dyadobacter sp. Leaf189]